MLTLIMHCLLFLLPVFPFLSFDFFFVLCGFHISVYFAFNHVVCCSCYFKKNTLNNRKIAWYYCGVRETVLHYYCRRIRQYFMVCCIYFIITGFSLFYLYFLPLCRYTLFVIGKHRTMFFQMVGHLLSTSLCGCHCPIGYGKFGRVTNIFFIYIFCFENGLAMCFLFVYLLSRISP